MTAIKFASASAPPEYISDEGPLARRDYSEALENFRTKQRNKPLTALERRLKQPVILSIVSQATILCEDYIYNKLRSVEPNKNGDGVKASVQQHWGLRIPTDASLEIQKLGAMMETKYPSLYVNISHQIMMPLRSDVAVRKAMICIGDYMFKNSIVTWGRIVGLFAVAGAIAAECVESGHSQHICAIVSVFSELIERHASIWICRQGGWVSFTSYQIYVTTLII